MKQLLALALIAAAAWYGYKNYGQLMNKKNSDVVVVNHSGRGVDRLRVSVGNQTVVVEALDDGATSKVGFQPHQDGQFNLVWAIRGVPGEREWKGGTATASAVETYKFEFLGENNVVWTSEMKEPKSANP